MSSNKKLLQAASGFINQSSSGLNVEDVFSSTVYMGNGSARSITNGIDLQNEGGMVWVRNRTDASTAYALFSTATGTQKFYTTQTEDDGTDIGATAFQFNSDGFGYTNSNVDNPRWNGDSKKYVSWTFRKAPKFFDIVTYTGDGNAFRSISHNLECIPGMIWIRCLTRDGSADDWFVAARDSSGSYFYDLHLNDQWKGQGPFDYAGSASYTMDSSSFSVDIPATYTNISGESYVAFLFAHDDSDDSIIKCGSYTGNGSNDGPEIDLGFEAQWWIVKKASATSGGSNTPGSFFLIDTMLGGAASTTNTDAVEYYALDSANAAGFYYPFVANAPTSSTGLKLEYTAYNLNESGGKDIYMAIRRGPMATPTSRADVFNLDTTAYTGADAQYPAFGVANFADFVIVKNRSTTEDVYANSRMQSINYLVTNSNAAEASGSGVAKWDYMTGAWVNAQNNGRGAYIWSRASEFFDVVCFEGNGGGARTIVHNCGTAPDMLWFKRRDANSPYGDWYVQHTGISSNNYLNLNTNAAQTGSPDAWNNTYAGSSVFTVGSDNNVSSAKYVVYLFASLSGISKMGTFSHTNGSSTNVDCGFSSGTYWVMVKRYDASGDWFVFDVGANIGAGNDSYIVLNSNAGEVGSSNYIAQLNSGFTMESDFLTGNYIYYAIAN